MHTRREERVRVHKVPQSLPSRGRSRSKVSAERSRSRSRSRTPSRRPRKMKKMELFGGIQEEEEDDSSSEEDLMSDFYDGPEPFDFIKER